MHLWQEVPFSTCWGGAKGSVALLKEFFQLGCASQDSHPRKSILRKAGTIGIEARRQILQSTWHQTEIRERKGPSRGIAQKREPPERSPCASKFEERSREITLQQEGCARKAAWDLAKSIYKLKKCWQSFLLLSYWSQGNAGAHLKITTGKRVRGWFRTFNAHAAQNGFELRWNGHSAEIQNPYRGGDGKLWSANKRGSTCVCSRSWPLRDCAMTRRYACILSLEKLCEEHGYSYEWVSGQQPRLTKKGRKLGAKRLISFILLFQGYRPVQNTKKSGSRDAEERLRDLPEWLEGVRK